ncbi:MAG: GNAT family N-acetyltransferase [Hydrogenibacillus schlegelii]|uniref:GNAT family N-acetyltransferase n=1 Tax=Hydrogenibacillus schlegelii TaxID=1484 RepID=A0A947GH07_HYDSH|nr:GNAT family N-acetyltransferase [Hydrogenibacillus schlegelii]
MIRLRRLAPPDVLRRRRALLRFIRRHGERRITAAALRRIARTAPEAWLAPGTAVYVALEPRAGEGSGGRLIGVLAALDYGLAASLLVVHRSRRNRGLGRALLAAALRDLGKLYGRIRADNGPSLAAARAAGLTPLLVSPPAADDLPPTVIVGGGRVDPEEARRCAISVF